MPPQHCTLGAGGSGTDSAYFRCVTPKNYIFFWTWGLATNALVRRDHYYCIRRRSKTCVFVEDAQEDTQNLCVFVEDAQEDAKTIVFLWKTLKR